MKLSLKQNNDKWFVEVRNSDKVVRKAMPDKETALKVIAELERKNKPQSEDVDNQPIEETAKTKHERLLTRYTENLDFDSFGSTTKRWIDESYQTLRNSTQERYLPILVKWILPRFSKYPIDQIKRSEIKTFLLGIYQTGKSKSTVGLVRDVLSNVFEQARDEELINHNPTTKILKRLKLERDKCLKSKPLNLKEMNIVIDTCKEHFPEMFAFFMIAFYTGMRLGEIIPLEWSDIDLEKREISVNKSFRLELIHTTKTDENRTVKISNALSKALIDYRLKSRQRILFLNKGKYYSQNKIRDYLKQILTIAGLRHVRFHDLRHTYASLMLSLGEPIHYVQGQLGHKNASMTLDRYGKFIPNDKNQGLNTIENALENIKN